MPYIKSNDGRREALRNGDTALTAGELNYQIFYFVKHNQENYLTEQTYDIVKNYVKAFLGDKPNYQRYNDVTGALIRCYVEIKRRLNIQLDILIDIAASYDDEIASYETKKCKENGDVE